MGYDFHLTPDGPRLIEINTNAGGALLNGLHTASLCDPGEARVPVLGAAPGRDDAGADRRDLRGGARGRRGPAPRSARVAIADERPARAVPAPRVRAVPRSSSRAPASRRGSATCASSRDGAGGSRSAARRSTSSTCATPIGARERRAARALRAAYLADEVVVTPSPREHHLLANKQRLDALLVARTRCASSASAATDARLLAAVVPETRALDELGARARLARRGASGCSSRRPPSRAAPSTAATRSRAASSRRSRATAASSRSAASSPGEVDGRDARGPRA